jgi:glycosyltransferase involved in cell wall biosynthesis
MQSSCMPKKLKIVFLNQTLGIGGAETLFRDLFDWLGKQGAEIDVWTTNTRFAGMLPFLVIQHIPVVIDLIGDWKGFLKGVLLLPLGIIYYGYLVFRNRHADVLFLSGFIEKILGSWWGRIFGIPVVWIEHGPFGNLLNQFGGFGKLLYLSVRNIPAAIVTPSQFTADWLTENLKVNRQKIHVISNALKMPIIHAKPVSNRVVCVSRLEKGKGHELLLSAWPEIVKQLPNASLHIVGEGNLDLPKIPGVAYRGWVPDAMMEMAKSEVVVFPTMWELEGFGMVAIEAMSLGRPVVAFNFGPLPEIVDSNTGILVKPGDTQKMALAVIELLKNDKLRKKMGASGREKYMKNFTFEVAGERYLQIFREACER